MYQYESALAIEYCNVMAKELADIMQITFSEDEYWEAYNEKKSKSVHNLFFMNNQNTIVIFDCNNKDIMYGIIVLGLEEENLKIKNLLLKWHKVCEEEYHMVKIDKIKNIFFENNSLGWLRNFYNHDILSLLYYKNSADLNSENVIKYQDVLLLNVIISLKLAILDLLEKRKKESVYIISFAYRIEKNHVFYCSLNANTEENFRECVKSYHSFRNNLDKYRYFEKKWQDYDITYGVKYISQFLNQTGKAMIFGEDMFIKIIKEAFVILRNEEIFGEYCNKNFLLVLSAQKSFLTKKQIIEFATEINQNVNELDKYIISLNAF